MVFTMNYGTMNPYGHPGILGMSHQLEYLLSDIVALSVNNFNVLQLNFSTKKDCEEMISFPTILFD